MYQPTLICISWIIICFWLVHIIHFNYKEIYWPVESICFWAVKLIILFVLLPVTLNSAHAEAKGTLLIIGQSISSNCNQKNLAQKMVLTGIWFSWEYNKAQDPLIWADCTEGSLWIPMGKELIERKITDQVNLLQIGVSGTKVQDWLPAGKSLP